MEEMFMQFIQSQQASMRNLETQIGQIASALSNRPQGGLPSDTQNPREEGKKCKVITLRSGKELEDPHNQKTSISTANPMAVEQNKENKDELAEVLPPKGSVDQRNPYFKIPYPQRLQKKNQNNKFQQFLEVFKKLSINIPFA